MKLQQINFPAYVDQFDAYLAFLDNKDEYQKFHKQIKHNIGELNRRIEKMQLAGDIIAAREAANSDRVTAKQELGTARDKVREWKDMHAKETKRLEEEAAGLMERGKKLKSSIADHARQVTKHEALVLKERADVAAQRESALQETTKAVALQTDFKARLDRIRQFKETV